MIQCNRTVTLEGLFTQLNSSRQKVSLIGSGCSLATEATAEISHYYNVPQVDRHLAIKFALLSPVLNYYQCADLMCFIIR